MEFKIVNSLSDKLYNELCTLVSDCDNYEPYYSCTKDDSFIQVVLLENGTLKGFASALIGDQVAEISGLVHPALRKCGYFKRMLSMIKNILPDNCTIIGSLPEALLNSNIKGELSYSEYLLRLDSLPNLDTSTINNSEFFFGESDYLMYLDEEEEPCAVLSLDFQDTFVNIYGVFVDEALRGKGFGYCLLTHFINDYFEEYSLPLVLNVSSNNTAALSLYKKCGFTEVSRIDFFYINV